MKRNLSWPGLAALGLALLCLFLPALQLRTPVTPARQWTLAGLLISGARALGQPKLRAHSPARMLHNLERLRRELGHGLRQQHATPLVFKLAVLIPPALYLAGLATLVALACLLAGWRLGMNSAALAGAGAAGYAAGISLWLTAAVRQDLRQLLGRADTLAPALQPWTHGLASQSGLTPQVGLWLLPVTLLAAALSAPGGSRR